MTAEEALAWIAEEDASCDRDPTRGSENLWCVCAKGKRTWKTATGLSLVHAVTRLKAKLEAR